MTDSLKKALPDSGIGATDIGQQTGSVHPQQFSIIAGPSDQLAAASQTLTDMHYKIEGVPSAWIIRAAEELEHGQGDAAQRYLEAGRQIEQQAVADADGWHGGGWDLD